ncbi:hypothetical protein [Vibrio aestuarianus]|nr:hypothetical protein [Vibrio aestuarianus]MDE1337689.1 hypothetical protein [Vibrio aestuarianus]
MAFLVRVESSVYGVQIECRGRVAHPLIGRYDTTVITGWMYGNDTQV